MADIFRDRLRNVSPTTSQQLGYSIEDRIRGQVPRNPVQNSYRYDDVFDRFGGTTDNPNYQHPYEQTDNLVDRFNKQPLTYSTGADGRVTVTRSMDKEPLPGGGTYPAFSKFYGQGQLSNSWILPEGAMSGPRFTTRNLPSTDQTRQQGFNTGMTNSSPNVAQVNQQNFWPDSSFKIPYSSPSGSNGTSSTPLPIFGATIDYASGRWRTPQNQLTGAPYGRFDTQRKTNPMNFGGMHI